MEKLVSVADFMLALKESEYTILVEGPKDRYALMSLGCSNVYALSGALFMNIERLAARHKDIVILTDLDSEGKRLYRELRTGLTQRGVRVHDELRHFLFRKTPVRQIEGLPAYLATLGRRGEKLPDFWGRDI